MFETFKKNIQRDIEQALAANMGQPPLEPCNNLTEPHFLAKELLAHPDIIRFCKTNPFAEAQRQITLNALWHVSLDAQVSEFTGGYHQHKPPISGRFPLKTTIRAIEDALLFVKAYETATQSSNQAANCASNFAKAAIDSISTDDQKAGDAFIQYMISKPIEAYLDIMAQAQRGSYTYFMPTINFLISQLKDDEVIKNSPDNAFFEFYRQHSLKKLQEIITAPENAAYIPTLNAIEDAVAFFDSFERSRKSGHDNHYQLDRYRYHGQTLPYLSDWHVFPTNSGLGLKDLIALRAIPAGLTMVAARTEFIDAFFNSPLNAKIHDDNHNRRFRSENAGYFERKSITSEADKLKAYIHFNEIIQDTILPTLRVTEDMSVKEQNIRKAMTVLYFEWLHEYAKTPDRESLITELKFAPDGPSAFEVVLLPDDKAELIEARRLSNRNLDSGALYSKGSDNCTVYYFMDKGRNFLTSAYNKVRNGFYDNPEGTYAIGDEFPDKDHRTLDVFVEATQRILTSFNIPAHEVGLDAAKIGALLENRVNGQILGQNLETYPGHDPQNPLNRAPRLASGEKRPDAIVQGFVLGTPLL